MKTHTLVVTLIIFLFSSCRDKDKPVERTDISFEIVSDSIYSRMPGALIKLKDYLAWEDPFGADDFVHILNLNDGHEIGTMVKRGQGPTEFSTPVITSAGNNNIFVFDLNTSHQAFYSIDNLKNNRTPYTRYKDNDHKNITTQTVIGKDQFVLLQPSENYRFKLINGDNILDFGPPFIDGEDFENKYSINQGGVKFHPQKNKFVFACYRLPYIEIYDIRKDMVSLHSSTTLEKDTYWRQGKEIKTDPSKTGIMDMTLTKDYIVTIQRDYQVDNTDESTVGMDFSKVPQTLFLYDYTGKIKRIVNVGIPIFRITGDTNSNTVYATGLESEFVIIKCEL